MSSQVVNQKKNIKIYYLDATPFWQHVRPRILLFSIGRTTIVESFIWYQNFSLQENDKTGDTPFNKKKCI